MVKKLLLANHMRKQKETFIKMWCLKSSEKKNYHHKKIMKKFQIIAVFCAKMISIIVVFFSCRTDSCRQFRSGDSRCLKRCFSWNINRLLISGLSRMLSHFRQMLPFDTPWKHHRTKTFLMFSGDIEQENWPEMG